MSLTLPQLKVAFDKIVNELLKGGPLEFTKTELKQAVDEAHDWAELPATKSSFNSNLTAGNFKSNATADQKRLALIFALIAIVEG